MAHITIDRRIALIQGPGVAVVASDLHGNLADLQRLVALMDAEEDAVLVLLGDLLHGPDIAREVWERDYRHLGEHYRDASAEVFRSVRALQAERPGRVLALMGNHDHAHVGGPRVAKFFDDEAATMEATLSGPEEVALLRSWLAALPLVGVSSAGVAFCHAAPPSRSIDAAGLQGLTLAGYEDVPLHGMYSQGWLGEVLWRRGCPEEGGRALLGSLASIAPALPCQLVVHGHEIAYEGWEVEHPTVLNLSTSFGMERSRKTWLRLELGRTYADAAALTPGRELLPLYPSPQPSQESPA